MQLTLNGEEADVRDAITVTDLLTEHDVKFPDMVSVELNGRILKRPEFGATALADGDKLEFLYLMGGGRWT